MSAFPASPRATVAAPPPPPPASAAPEDDPPFADSSGEPATTHHLSLFAEAGRRAQPVRRAATISAMSGWTLLALALLTLMTGLFSLRSAALGVLMLLAALIELRGSRALKRFDRSACTKLAINQLVLGAVLIIYAATGIAGVLHSPGPYETYIADGGQVAELMEPIARLHMLVSVVAYVGLLVGVLISQPCLAWYYLSRRRKIESFVEQTPGWVRKALEMTRF